MIRETLFVPRSMQTSLGPPGEVGPNSTLPVSTAQRRSLGSMTTLCTEIRCCPSPGPAARLVAWSG